MRQASARASSRLEALRLAVRATLVINIAALAARAAESRDEAFVTYREGTADAAVPATDGRAVDTILFVSKYGKIRLQLRKDWAPAAAEAVAQLASREGPQGRACEGCTWYRHEPVPEGWGTNNFYGPPYALLQGGLHVLGAGIKHENPGARPVRVGSAAFISDTMDFFIGTADHAEWGAAFTVFGQVLDDDLPLLDRIPFEPYRNSTDAAYHFTTRWLLEPVPFTLQPMTRLEALQTGGQKRESTNEQL